MTLVFTNPLFTIIFEILFFGAKITVIKVLGGEQVNLEHHYVRKASST
jgi:drug/metabolite transporter (DMT)-like permease